MKSRLILALLFLLLDFSGSAQSFRLPDSWEPQDVLLVKTKGSHTGSQTTIRFQSDQCTYEENLEGKSITIPFQMHPKTFEALLFYLKDRKFNELKFKKLKTITYDKNSSIIYWLRGGKQLFRIGYDADIEVHRNSEKRFNMILLHLIQLAEQHTEKLKVKVNFTIHSSVKESMLDLNYRIDGSGQRAWFGNSQIPNMISLMLFRVRYSFHFALLDGAKGLNGENPGTIWTLFEPDIANHTEFEILLERRRLVVRPL
ncbi:MAG TPA: hypothetical protein DCD96_05860 [Flavobacteriales bacterium]|nr:hypothetical protein [Flavobacteriales bacterium]HRJ36495.1 hypothetical protein [Flavobacteriales bacterium]HRJ39227.1 hypothetical protein [Flavobacteriales bacterium]